MTFFPEKIPKRNLLQYAESIGGKPMYMRFQKALREAKVASEQELDERQINIILKHLSEQEGFSMQEAELKDLIAARDRRRHAYIQMAIDSENDEEGAGAMPGISSGFGRRARYDYAQSIGQKSSTSAMGKGAISSIGRVRKTSTLGQEKKLQSRSPKNTAAGSRPTTSILRIQRGV